MNITLSAPSPALLPALGQLYLDSFPPEERRPWPQIAAGTARPALLCASAAGEEAAGLVSLRRFPGFTYIEHLCTQPAMRGSGIGAEILRLLAAEGPPLLLEVEHPKGPGSIEQRRIDFYRRNGFRLLDYDYVQPPYAPGLPSVPLLLMSTDPALDPALATRTLHREVYSTVQ